MTDIDVIHDVAAWYKMFKMIRAAGSVRIETLQRNKDGYTYPVDTTINYMLHKGKEYCLIVGRDVAEQKKVEGALKESESKYRRLVESAGAGMATINLAGAKEDFLQRTLDAGGDAGPPGECGRWL